MWPGSAGPHRFRKYNSKPIQSNWYMITRTFRIDPNALDTPAAREALDRAAIVIGQGGLVAFPTETVYGLGANALDPAAECGGPRR